MITIIDCGSQLTHNIARRVRELGVYTEIVPYHTNPATIKSPNLEGLVISGGQFGVYDSESPQVSPTVFDFGVPVLGICYGHQLVAHLLGGRVVPSKKREYGETHVFLTKESPLFTALPKNFYAWMSHGDVVAEVPAGFEVTAESNNGHIAAMQKGNIFSVQFHPEVDHTQDGRRILENFIDICNAQRTWNPEAAFERIVAETTEKIKGKVGVGGISGGVDSTTASVLIGKIAGSNYHPIFVDNGLLRHNEAQEVLASLEPFGLHVHFVDAASLFLSRLQGVTDPDEKRKIIGNTFIEVFEAEARKIPRASYLVQGTLYPDVIESVPIYGASSKIKRHHNVGGLPEHMELEVVEPLRTLFKDEVRDIATRKLGMPKEIVWRHPFPGPGLAVRIIGAVTPERLRILRHADNIYITELQNRGLYYDIDQAFAVLMDTQSVGVMGDAGTYQGVIGLRAVTTNDFMTADWYPFERRDLAAIANRIINEVKGVNRVVYDVSQKPPATIEWE